MNWFNYYGLVAVILLLIPNIFFAFKNDKYKNLYKNVFVEILEQIARYSCMILMIFNIPFTYFNFWFANAFIVYLLVNGFLIVFYYFAWIVFWNKSSIYKSLLLSILPSLIFLISGVILAYIPLIIFAILFTICHIFISCKNTN